MTFDVCPDDIAALSFDGIFNNPSGIYTDADGNSENVATINALIAVNEMNDVILVSEGPTIDLSSVQIGEETVCIYTVAYAPSTVAISANTICSIPGLNTLFSFCSLPILDDIFLSDYLNEIIYAAGPISIDEMDEFLTEGIVIDQIITIPTGFCGDVSDEPSCITVTNNACVVIPPDEVPTLGQWSLIILALLLINVCVLGIRQKNTDKITLQNGKRQ